MERKIVKRKRNKKMNRTKKYWLSEEGQEELARRERHYFIACENLRKYHTQKRIEKFKEKRNEDMEKETLKMNDTGKFKKNLILSERTKNALKQENIQLDTQRCGSQKEKKYLKSQKTIFLTRAYDLLENLLLATKYFEYEYKITLDVLLVLLYLYPKTIFTIKDFRLMPRTKNDKKLSYFLDNKLLKLVKENTTYTKQQLDTSYKTNDVLITLTQKTKTIIPRFYKIVFGEEKIQYTNKFIKRIIPEVMEMNIDQERYTVKNQISITKKLSKTQKELINSKK